jgi:hypothetical protein
MIEPFCIFIFLIEIYSIPCTFLAVFYNAQFTENKYMLDYPGIQHLIGTN